jgi:hypothetical protein
MSLPRFSGLRQGSGLVVVAGLWLAACSSSGPSSSSAGDGGTGAGAEGGAGGSGGGDSGAAEGGGSGGGDSSSGDGGGGSGDAAGSAALAEFLPFGQGGMVECNAGGASGDLCVWSTTQKTPAPFTGENEIAACPVSYANGAITCTAPVSCLTCGMSFGYASAPQKGQPRFFPDGVHIGLWVSNPSLAQGSCGKVQPGSGCNGDLWTATLVGTASLSLDTSSLVNWTHEPDNGGVLFNTSNAQYMSFSERYADGDGSAAQGFGCWQVRVFTYSIENGAVAKGNEVAGSPFTTGECGWTENSGFFDPASGQLVVTAQAPTSAWWQPELYAIDPQAPAGTHATVFLDWATTQPDCPWNEHVHLDPTGKFVVWASTHGNGGFGGYDGCAASFPGNPPLDLYGAPIARGASGSSAPITADETQAKRLTQFNELGSTDRSTLCSWLGQCSDGSSNPTSFSGGEGNWPFEGTYVFRAKTAAGVSAVVTIDPAAIAQ